jgi:hypothetical protein
MIFQKRWNVTPKRLKPHHISISHFILNLNIDGYALWLHPEENTVPNKTNHVVAYWGVDGIQETSEKRLCLCAREKEKNFYAGNNIMFATVKKPFGNVLGLIYKPQFHFKD